MPHLPFDPIVLSHDNRPGDGGTRLWNQGGVSGSPPRWPRYVFPISLVAWVLGVCLIHNPDELGWRAVVAFQIFIFELIVVGFVSLTRLFINALWDWPARSRENETSRRLREGRCVACGYSLIGNESGVCPECGITPTNALLTHSMVRMSPNSPARWAVAILIDIFIIILLMAVVA